MTPTRTTRPRASDRARTVTANGIEVSYQDLGRGTPVVLRHTLSASALAHAASVSRKATGSGS